MHFGIGIAVLFAILAQAAPSNAAPSRVAGCVAAQVRQVTSAFILHPATSYKLEPASFSAQQIAACGRACGSEGRVVAPTPNGFTLLPANPQEPASCEFRKGRYVATAAIAPDLTTNQRFRPDLPARIDTILGQLLGDHRTAYHFEVMDRRILRDPALAAPIEYERMYSYSVQLCGVPVLSEKTGLRLRLTKNGKVSGLELGEPRPVAVDVAEPIPPESTVVRLQMLLMSRKALQRDGRRLELDSAVADSAWASHTLEQRGGDEYLVPAMAVRVRSYLKQAAPHTGTVYLSLDRASRLYTNCDPWLRRP